MPSTIKSSKSSRKEALPKNSSKEEKVSAKVAKKRSKPVDPPEEDSDEQENSEEGAGSESEEDDWDDGFDEGIDEEGMERLMKALGDDGLDEFDQVQLNLALGGSSHRGDEDGDGDSLEVELSEEGGQGVEDEDEDEAEEHGAGNGLETEVESGEEESEGDEGNGTQEEEVALDDVDFVDEDTVPRQKLEIDNKIALDRICETIRLDPSLPWTETLVLTCPETIDVDVHDDLNRELAFYKQALHAANAGRALAAKHNLPFTRPSDYFAEMVKTDAHMERIRQRLLDETASIKKSEDKRREREGKKFGKQVQVEKLKEREKSKKEMGERLKGLKRKRGDVLDKPQGDDDDFDVAVEDAIADRPAKRGRGAGPAGRGRGITRTARDSKYGFGGANRRSKQNTRDSTDDFGSRGGGRGGRGGRGGTRGGRGRGRGGAQRLGKSRRVAARSKS